MPAVALLGALAVLLAGCGGRGGPAGPEAPSAHAEAQAAGETPWEPGVWEPPPPDAVPTEVRIPGIDVAAPTTRLGLNADRTLEVPDDFDRAGWYTGAARPGETGPAVIAGHVDSHHEPAVFFRLHELRPGDLAHVRYDTGYVSTFEVTDVEQVDKDAFPTDRVYGETDGSRLRLITCGGEFDSAARSYRSNVIVYASPTGR